MKMLRDSDEHHHHSIGQLALKLRSVCNASRLEQSKLFHVQDTAADVWSGLPPAVLENILFQLSTSSSFAAVRLVCKSWLEASSAFVGSVSPLVCFSHVIVSRFPNLEQVSFLLCGGTLNYERLLVCSRLKRLQSLTLPHSCYRVGDWPSALRDSGLSFLRVDEDLFKRVGIQPTPISDCSDTQVDDQTLRRLTEVLPLLHGLDIGDSYSLTGDWLGKITSLRALKHLQAVSKTGQPQVSAFLASALLNQLPVGLTTLRLGPVHPSAFQSLLTLTQLQRLSLVGSDLNRLPLKGLVQWDLLPALQQLSFSCYELSPGTIRSLPHALQSLSLTSISIYEPAAVLAEEFTVFTMLHRLQLHLQSRLSTYDDAAIVLSELHKVVEHVSSLPHLTVSFMDHENMNHHLGIERPIHLACRKSARLGLPCAIWKPAFISPTDACSITRLCFAPGVSLSDENAASLATLRTLETLELGLRGRIPASFTAFRCLKHLTVSWDHGQEGLYAASTRSRWTSPDSPHAHSPQPVRSLSWRLTHLHRRSPVQSAFTESVAVLLKLESLESLHLAHPAFSDGDLRQLGSLTQLTELVFKQDDPEPSITSRGLVHLSGKSVSLLPFQQ